MKEDVKYFIMLRFGMLVRLYDRIRVKQENWRRRAPVFVLTSGKVASTAVAASLKSARVSKYVHQVHFLTPNGIRDEMRKQLRCSIPYIARNTTLGRYLAKKWAVNPAVRPKIISLVREPVGQLVSVAFQDVKRQSPHLMTNGAVDVGKTVRFLGEWMSSTPPPHRISYEWIQRELNPAAGVNVYASPFDVSKGYQIYHGSHADLLVIRMENLEEVFSEACCEFLGYNGRIDLLCRNSSHDKEHRVAYQQVRSEFKMEKSRLQKIFSDELVRHFYSDLSDDIYSKWI